jgi:hypothetical protein
LGNVPQAFYDTERSVEIAINADNVVGNKVNVYTNNFVPGPGYVTPAIDTSTGFDGAGLVGQTDNTKTAAMVWWATDTNTDYAFDGTLDGVGEVFLVDKAHIATFDPNGVGGPLDNGDWVRCDDESVLVPNTLNDGLYPQAWGHVGGNDNYCIKESEQEFPESPELATGYAVIAFDFVGGSGTLNQTGLPAVTSPLYVPVGFEFSGAVPQEYKTISLTVEVITQ